MRTISQHRTTHHDAALYLPWWRLSFWGYIVGLFLIGIAVSVALSIPQIHLMWTSLCLASVIVGFVWGVSPALVTTVFGFIAFTFLVFPQHNITSTNIMAFGPFTVAQFIIAFLAGQNAVKYRRTLAAERKIHANAQELAAINQKLEQTNQELERANRHKDYFITRAAHELRTPLTTILGEVQLALRRLYKKTSTEEEARRHFEKIEARAHVLQALVEDLIELSSLHTGEKLLQFGICRFGELCREVIEDQRICSGCRIELQLPPDPVIIRADSKRLTQVVINLVGNAVHYAREGTVINVCVSMEHTSMLFQVHNEGPALSLEQQARLFDPFYRTPYAETLFREGWGLGLTVSKEIVEQHSGQIWVKSSEGEGTTFFVRIPLQIEQKAQDFPNQPI